jgi:predicted TIM-barrel fold metal-dependent hydrolase
MKCINMDFTRRHFLKRTLGTTAACGLARLGAATDNTPTTESITDTHVYLGHWPHQQLSGEAPTKLFAELRHTGISQAWIGSFDGLFHKDVAVVNERLALACTRIGRGTAIAFGTINPTLPDWEDDIRRCHETFHMPGIRLHPTYHGYTLDDKRFVKLLELAAARGLIVQLVGWMEAERHLLLNPHVTEADLSPLAEKIVLPRSLKLIVTNYLYTSEDQHIRALTRNENVYFDFARAIGAEAIGQLISVTSPRRVVFGSGAPLHSIEMAAIKLNKLSRDIRRQIGSANAAAMLARKLGP